MRPPLTTDIAFLLVEGHDSLFSLSKSTGGLRLPNARGEPRPMAEATQERKLLGVGSSAWFGAASVWDVGLLPLRQPLLWEGFDEHLTTHDGLHRQFIAVE